MMIYSPTRVLVFVIGFCLVSGCHYESQPRVKTLHAKPPTLVVTSVDQAARLIQRFESELYDKLYGKGKPHPPLASAEEPFSVIETQESYVFEFRKPFGLSGGGYVKTFRVHRATGRVTRGAWRLGR